MCWCVPKPLVAAIAISLVAAGCATATPATPTATPTAPPTATPTKPPPTATPTIVATATPTSPPAAATKPAVTTTAGAVSVQSLVSQALGRSEYSFDFQMIAAGQTFSGKANVKGQKLREDISVAGISGVLLADIPSKVAYVLMPDQKSAIKIDFNQIASQAPAPTQQLSSLPADTRYVGQDTIAGQTAAVFEAPSAGAKFWLSTDTGFPLKGEVSTPSGAVRIEYSNYQFSPQPDSLFELPPGTQVSELPIPFLMPTVPAKQ